MTTTTSNRRRRVMLCAASLLAMTACAQPALAQSEETQPVAITALPLGDALLEIGERYDVSIIVSDELTRGRTAASVEGDFTVRQALRNALRGSGLTFQNSPGGAFLIVEIASSDDNQIVVTGQQIDRSLQDTKESVAVLTQEDFETRSLFSINDAVLQTANVAGQATNVSIRGVSRLGFAIGGIGDTSTTYYDEVALTNQAVGFISQNLWDVEQIEFLRGPQSTNFGRNALIGAVVVRTNNPKLDEYEAAARAEIGNFGTRNFEGMANLPVSSKVALRITGERSQTDGFIDNVTLGTSDAAQQEFTTLRAKALFELSDRFRAVLSVQYVDGRNGFAPVIAPIDGPFDTFESRNDIASFEEFEGLTGSLNVKYDVSDTWTIQSITAFADGEFDRFLDADNTERDGGSSIFPTSELNISQELRAEYNGGTSRGVIGGYFFQNDFDTRFVVSSRIDPARAGIPPTLLPFYPGLFTASQDSSGETDITNFAIFSQWEYDLTSNLTLSAGLRYDRESFDSIINGVTALDPSTPLPDPAAAGALAEMQQPGSGALVEAGVAAINGALSSQLGTTSSSRATTFEAFLPEFGLTYRMSPDVQASLFYKRGYRAGGVQAIPTGELNEFDPEYLDNIEFSIRSEWFDRTLTLNANAYYGFWTDQQVNLPFNGNEFDIRTENAAESRIWGIEFEARYRPTQDTQVFASLGYANTNILESCSVSVAAPDLPDCEIDGVLGKDLSGNEFGASPDWTLAAGGQQFVTDRVYVQANVTYQAGSFRDIENSPVLEVDGYVLTNAALGYEGDWFDVRLYGRNLLDEFYELSRFRGELPTEIGISPGTPREYGIIIGARF